MQVPTSPRSAPACFQAEPVRLCTGRLRHTAAAETWHKLVALLGYCWLGNCLLGQGIVGVT